MSKSLVFFVSASIEPGTGGKTVATFYRYRPGEHPEYDDWMQTHENLTEASCRRLMRILDRGDAIIWPDRIAISRRVNEARLSRIVDDTGDNYGEH